MSKAKNIHDIEVKIEKEAWSKYLDKAFNKIKNTVSVDGFRKGKVTREIFNKKVGVESLYNDALNFAIDDEFTKLMDKKEYEPIVRPTVDVKDVNKEGATIVFTVTTKPEIKLGDYKNLGVKKEEVKVTDEEVNHEIEHLRRDYAEIIVKEDSASNGDTVIIDFDGYLDGEQFEGGKSENYPLELGSNTFIPGFEDQLVGMKKGEEKDINVTFPDDYPSENLKGKPVVFKVKVNEVKTKQLPELNEEFFLDLGLEEVKTEKDFIEHIKKDLEHEKKHYVEDKYIDELLTALDNSSEIESIPDEFINNEADRMYDQVSQNISMQGITMEQYLKLLNKTESEVKDTFKEEATKRVKSRMLLEEIVNVEDIKATEEEVTERVQNLAEMYKMTKEEITKYFGGTEMLEYDVQMKKAIELLQGK